MTAHLAAPRADAVISPLTYIAPQTEKPRFLSQAYTGGEAVFDFTTEMRPTEIRDLRPHAADFTLDRAGFSFLRAPTAAGDLWDDEVVSGIYAEETRSLIARELGAARVEIFDATRRSDGGNGAANPDGQRGAANRIHVDYTAKSGPQRARDVFGEAAFDRLIAGGARIVQVNLWRPITGPVRRSPLALADAASVRPEDLVATDQVFPDRVGEIYHLAHHPEQSWWHAPEMTRDEVLLIKGWDSDAARARFTPHTAFALPDQERAAPRESIEMRAYAVIR